jgi:methylenetetrahydrofolate dehydrogenase (NADP+)/methenyltetrahydrofolate cyclohydrolase
MVTKIIDGTSLAKDIKKKLKEEITDFTCNTGITPTLAVIGAGNDPSSRVYIEQIIKNCRKSGIKCLEDFISEDSDETELINTINRFNNDKNCHAILIKLPLPAKFSKEKIIEAIAPHKDIDCINPVNLGKLLIGRPPFFPCTPLGIYRILQNENIKLKGRHIVVVGRGETVGKPLISLLLRKDVNATVTVCHSGTENIEHHTSSADILIVAMGKPEFIKGYMVKESAIVIDAGINVIEDKTSKTGTKLAGDVAIEEILGKAEAITPVPGGVGPVTISMIIENTFNAAKNVMRDA